MIIFPLVEKVGWATKSTPRRVFQMNLLPRVIDLEVSSDRKDDTQMENRKKQGVYDMKKNQIITNNMCSKRMLRSLRIHLERKRNRADTIQEYKKKYIKIINQKRLIYFKNSLVIAKMKIYVHLKFYHTLKLVII